MKKRLLITGGSGFLGSRLTRYYRDDFEVLSLGSRDLDITDRDRVDEVIGGFRPDYIIHGAAIASTVFCEERPEDAYEINVEGALNVGRAAKKIGAKMVFLSTEQVFNGNKDRGPYSEEDTPCPDTAYGRYKLEAERRLREVIEKLWIVRFTWLFDIPREGCAMSENILWNTVKDILKNQKVSGSAYEYRGMTDATEIVENFARIFEIPYGIYHMGGVNNQSRYQVVELIFRELGRKGDDPLLVRSDKYMECPRDLRLNTDKLKNHGIRFEETEVSIRKKVAELMA